MRPATAGAVLPALIGELVERLREIARLDIEGDRSLPRIGGRVGLRYGGGAGNERARGGAAKRKAAD